MENKSLQEREGYTPATDEMGRPPEERRAAFDASPVARINGNEIFDWVEPLNMREIRANVVPWMEENGYLRNDHRNTDTGWDNIAITEKCVRDGLAHGSWPEKIQVFAALPEMIRGGVYIGTTSGKAYQQGMKRHLFATKIDVGGKSLLVGFVISDDASGKRFYDHELIEIKNLDGLTPQGGTIGLDTEKALRTRQDSESIMNLIQDALKVNSKI